MKITSKVKSPVFHIKDKHPLSADENDDTFHLSIPNIEYAEEFSRRLLKSISKHKKKKSEGKDENQISFIFTGDLLLPPMEPPP